jgi:hypothetical protein
MQLKLSKKEKNKKKKDKEKVKLLKSIKIPKNCKTECCEKFKKSEDKRCKRCPMFDLIEKRAI